MAPEGQDCFYVLIPVPNNQSKIDWSIEGEKMKNLVIDKMEKDLMPNLRENIVEDFYLTPDYFEKELNTKYGSGFSIQPKFSQSAYFRFHNKSEIYDGLYFVGAGTHPGAGVPGVMPLMNQAMVNRFATMGVPGATPYTYGGMRVAPFSGMEQAGFNLEIEEELYTVIKEHDVVIVL